MDISFNEFLQRQRRLVQYRFLTTSTHTQTNKHMNRPQDDETLNDYSSGGTFRMGKNNNTMTPSAWLYKRSNGCGFHCVLFVVESGLLAKTLRWNWMCSTNNAIECGEYESLSTSCLVLLGLCKIEKPLEYASIQFSMFLPLPLFLALNKRWKNMNRNCFEPGMFGMKVNEFQYTWFLVVAHFFSFVRFTSPSPFPLFQFSWNWRKS